MAFENFDNQSPDKVDAFLKENGITLYLAAEPANCTRLPGRQSIAPQ